MKKLILTSVTFLLISVAAIAQGGFLDGFTKDDGFNKVQPSKQDLSYEIRGSYERPVFKETLDKAKTLNDFIDGYPTNWIEEYVSVEIIAINNGKEMRTVSTNEKLTAEQKSILKSADLNSDIDINVKYKAANTLSSLSEDKSLDISMTVINIRMTAIPETEAQFTGGKKEMSAYIKESVINKIPETVAEKIKAARVLFTINAKGEIVETILIKSSGDEKTDQLMMDTINKMPNWKPAENAKGVKVKQYFQFSIGQYGC